MCKCNKSKAVAGRVGRLQVSHLSPVLALKKVFCEIFCGGCLSVQKFIVTLQRKRRKGRAEAQKSPSGYAKIAQLVEHDLAKVGVAGSSPVFRSIPP